MSESMDDALANPATQQATPDAPPPSFSPSRGRPSFVWVTVCARRPAGHAPKDRIRIAVARRNCHLGWPAVASRPQPKQKLLAHVKGMRREPWGHRYRRYPPLPTTGRYFVGSTPDHPRVNIRQKLGCPLSPTTTINSRTLSNCLHAPRLSTGRRCHGAEEWKIRYFDSGRSPVLVLGQSRDRSRLKDRFRASRSDGKPTPPLHPTPFF